MPSKKVRQIKLFLKHLILRWSWLIFVGLSVILATLPLLRDGLSQSWDLQYHMNRLYQYQEQFFAGQFYPRWLEGSNAGLGSPTFIFYPPMFVWAALPFAIMNFSLSQQLVGSNMVALCVAAIGAYIYVRLWLPYSRIAWIGIILLICCSPYLLFNIYYRGAFAEAWAMAWLVWVLLGMLIIAKTQRLIYCIPLTLATAMVVLSHVPTLLFLCMFSLIAPWVFSETNLSKTIFKTYLSLALGLLVSSFFLMPLVIFRNEVNTEVLSWFGRLVPSNHFIVIDLLRFTPKLNDFDPVNRILLIPFCLGAITLLCFVVLAITRKLFPYILLRREAIKTNADSKPALLLVTALLISLLMMTDISTVIYRYIPILDKIQFSWRWLSLASICMPFLWIWLLDKVNAELADWSTHSRYYFSTAIIVSLVLFSLSFNISNIGNDSRSVSNLEEIYSQIDPFPYENLSYPLVDIGNMLMQDQDGRYALSDGGEYLPRWVVDTDNYVPGCFCTASYPLVDTIQGEAAVADVEWQYGRRQFRVEAAEDTELALRMFAWPSWRVQVGESLRRMQRQDLTYEAATGRLTVTVPAGEHWVEVKYVGSLAERWGWFWSSCGLVIVGGIVVWDRRQQRRLKQAEPASAEVLN